MLVTYIVVFILGSLWGSFSNVCIYRLPERGNVVFSRSACRSCQSKISWFDNIPFVSFIILKGKCRNCNFKIPFQYFLVELIVSFGFLLSFYFFGFTIDQNLVGNADENAIILHCLPAYRSKEITDEIIENKKSRIFDQAENRLHVQQALLASIFSK